VCVYFIARAGCTTSCLCVSLLLCALFSLLTLYKRGSVCVYFIARLGYTGQCVYFRFFFMLFIHRSRCTGGAVCVYISFLIRGMLASACVYIFIHEFVLLAPQSLICRQCMCHIICLKFCVFLIFSHIIIHIISMI